MKKNTLLYSIIVLLILGNLLLLYMVMAPKPKGPAGEGPKALIIERLQFDPEQVKAYEELIHQHRKDVHHTEMEIGALKNQLYSTLNQPVEANVFDSITDLIGKKQIEMERVHYAHFVEIRKLCKPEQLEAFDKLSEDLARLFAPKRPRKKP